MKKFLEEYGWTIVLAIVVILIISIASPLGSSIKGSITNIVNGFGAKANFERINNKGSVSDVSGEQLDLTHINVAGVVGDFSTKGNLVTINGNQFRVLSTSGTVAKVMMMDNYTSTKFNNSSVTTPFGSRTGQKYTDSTLDQTMTTYYNGLPEAIQDAIVEQNINQSMYQWISGTNTSAGFSAWYKNPFTDTDTSGANYYLTRIAEINLGGRKVYALDVDDVIAYLGSNSTAKDVNEMFFGVRNNISRSVWLRSASTGNSYFAFCLYGDSGRLISRICQNSYEVRPAFVLDLSLLS